jgi:hypothetical protein
MVYVDVEAVGKKRNVLVMFGKLEEIWPLRELGGGGGEAEG